MQPPDRLKSGRVRTLSVRFTDEQYEQLKARAEAKRVRLGQYVRELVVADLGVQEATEELGRRTEDLERRVQRIEKHLSLDDQQDPPTGGVGQ